MAAGHDPQQLAIVGGVFVIGLVFYFVMKGIRRSQGVDVTLAVQGDPHRIGSVRFRLCPQAAGARARSGRSCEA